MNNNMKLITCIINSLNSSRGKSIINKSKMSNKSGLSVNNSIINDYLLKNIGRNL